MHEVTENATNYQSYLLRLWQEQPHLPWRGTAQNVQTGEVIPFADVEKLFAYLSSQLTRTIAPRQPDSDGSSQ